jgi:hypothetical protein
MEHVDWLHPDHIILANPKKSVAYQQFTKHMRSRNFQNLRLLKVKDTYFIRYQIDGDYFWYSAMILQIKSKDYYIDIHLLLHNEEDKQLENNYIPLNREEKLNKLLK